MSFKKNIMCCVVLISNCVIPFSLGILCCLYSQRNPNAFNLFIPYKLSCNTS